MKAIVIGATGAVGKDLVTKLLDDSSFGEVIIFVRKDNGVSHPKLAKHIINFDNVEEWEHLVQGDVLFSCLGTTLKAAGSKEAQWKIDFDYQYNFAKIAQKNGVSQYILVSASGANPKSMIFYSKMKGQLEEKVKELKFSKIAIMQPPILIRKNSDRVGENIGIKLLKFFNYIGLFKSQKPMSTEVVAQAMLKVAQANQGGTEIFSPEKINKWGLCCKLKK